jgi:hypothetical protein
MTDHAPLTSLLARWVHARVGSALFEISEGIGGTETDHDRRLEKFDRMIKGLELIVDTELATLEKRPCEQPHPKTPGFRHFVKPTRPTEEELKTGWVKQPEPPEEPASPWDKIWQRFGKHAPDFAATEKRLIKRYMCSLCPDKECTDRAARPTRPTDEELKNMTTFDVWTNWAPVNYQGAATGRSYDGPLSKDEPEINQGDVILCPHCKSVMVLMPDPEAAENVNQYKCLTCNQWKEVYTDTASCKVEPDTDTDDDDDRDEAFDDLPGEEPTEDLSSLNCQCPKCKHEFKVRAKSLQAAENFICPVCLHRFPRISKEN